MYPGWVSRFFTPLANAFAYLTRSVAFLTHRVRIEGALNPIPSLDVAETADTLQVRSHIQYNAADHITPSNVLRSPLDQFHVWFNDARAAGVVEPDAMCLSTATSTGTPSSRMVLFKQLDKRGFVFYTNYTSRKSEELDQNPSAALLFFWREMSRQVRVVGRVEKVGRVESAAYFKSRPTDSQLGAWASKQSSVIGENDLQARVAKYHDRFGIDDGAKTGDISPPEFWGGWRVIPSEIEFWLGKPSRLHDRVRYIRVGMPSDEEPQWIIDRLSP